MVKRVELGMRKGGEENADFHYKPHGTNQLFKLCIRVTLIFKMFKGL